MYLIKQETLVRLEGSGLDATIPLFGKQDILSLSCPCPKPCVAIKTSVLARKRKSGEAGLFLICPFFFMLYSVMLALCCLGGTPEPLCLPRAER